MTARSRTISAGRWVAAAITILSSVPTSRAQEPEPPPGSGVTTVPGADNFTHRRALSHRGEQWGTGSNKTASDEGKSEPSHADVNANGRTLWWKWTAPANGQANIYVRSAQPRFRIKPVLAVYTGDALINLRRLRSDHQDVIGDPAHVSFDAIAGVQYQIVADTQDGCGAMKVNVDFVRKPELIGQCAGTDIFSHRALMKGSVARGAAHNQGYGREGGEIEHYQGDHNYSPGRSAWWAWQAPENGKVIMTLSADTGRAGLAVYAGSSLALLSRVAQADTTAAGTAVLAFFAQKGLTYAIAADTGPGEPVANLSWDLRLEAQPGIPAAQVGHDKYDLAPMLGTAWARGAASTLSCRSDDYEPDHLQNDWSANPNHSVWWKWRAPDNGQVTMSLAADRGRHGLAVYVGSSFKTFRQVIQIDGPSARVSFAARRGEVYSIAADRPFDDDAGNLTLDVKLVPSAGAATTKAAAVATGQPSRSETIAARVEASPTVVAAAAAKISLDGLKADFDGDAAPDFADYDPNTGAWTIRSGRTGTSWTRYLGDRACVPVPADYDGDGRCDVAVYSTQTFTWHVLRSSDQVEETAVWGWAGVVPLLGDHDGDGFADYMVADDLRGYIHVLNGATGATHFERN